MGQPERWCRRKAWVCSIHLRSVPVPAQHPRSYFDRHLSSIALPEQPSTKEVLDLCDELLNIRPDRRENYLASACANSPELMTQARRLLKAVQDSGRFMRVREE